MRVTLLGTGSPVPLPERAGTAIHVAADGADLLIDCGPGTVRRLVENRIHPGTIDRLLFTHHHVDHNAAFFDLLITNWARGEGILEIHGPEPWTGALLESLYDVYEDDLRYRQRLNDHSDDIWEVPTHAVTDGATFTTDRFRVEAREVEHSIETYAYRVTDRETGRDVVFSGDTRKIDRLAEFAADAAVLIQDCCIAPVTDAPPDDEQFVWESYTEPLDPEKRDSHRETHCTPTDAGEIAAAAGVDRLVLTHLLPYRDESETRALAAGAFDGEVAVAYDGLALEL